MDATQSILKQQDSASVVEPQSYRESIRRLLKDHSSSDVRAALIRWWIESNSLDLAECRDHEVIGLALGTENSKQVTSALNVLQGELPPPSFKALEYAFEQFRDPDERRESGVVYTPQYIVDYLVRTSLALWEGEAPPTICDPSCGSAGFLLRAADHLHKRYSVSYEEAFTEYLYGFDTDETAIKDAKLLIHLKLLRQGTGIPAGNLQLSVHDSLLTSRAELAATDEAAGFDIVTTNPPYVKLQNLNPAYREKLENKYADYTLGSFGLAPLFLVRSWQLLKPRGIAALITQNNLFTSLAGREVRRHLKAKKALRRIIDFGHEQVFNEVQAYTCLVFLGKSASSSFEFGRYTPDQIKNGEEEKLNFSSITTESLDSSKWRLAEEPHRSNLHRIEDIGTPLGELCDIKVGFATLKDKVFLVTETEEGCVTGRKGDLPQKTIERAITRPAVKISELETQSDLNQNDLRIIFPYRRRDGDYVPIPEKELEEDYRATYQYLCEVRPLLAERDKGRNNYPKWYSWGRTQGMRAPGPKLLTKTFNDRPRFFLDQTDQLFCNGYAVFAPSRDLFHSLDIEALQVILNSQVMHYYSKLTSFQIEGNYQCYQKNFIERFGIPHVTEGQRNQLVDADTEEREQLVADLYGLASEDLQEIVDPTGG